MRDDPILVALARVEANQAQFGTEIAALRAAPPAIQPSVKLSDLNAVKQQIISIA